MFEKLRKTGALLVGGTISILVVFGVENVGHLVYPPSEGMTFSDTGNLSEPDENLPVGALIVMLVAWVFGTALGGIVACVIAGKSPRIYSRIIGALTLLFAMISISHSLWFTLLTVLIITVTTIRVGSLDWWWRK